MKIYTKTGNLHGYFEHSLFFKISENQTYKPNSIFWYDQHDFTRSGVLFSDCLYDSAWQHLRKDSTSKILLFFADEYYNLRDLKNWAETIIRERINPNQLYIVCIDENWKRWTDTEFLKLGINGVNVDSLNLLMERVEFQSPKPLTHRFSAFSRNYLKWRLKLFIELFNKDILKDFNYTFNNIMPYGNVIIYPPKEIKEHAISFGYVIDEKLHKWIDQIPYTLQGDNVGNKLSNEIYDKMTASGINFVIESHFDPFWNFHGDEHIGFKQFSPAFPTEKTYKAIGCGRPFIVASTPEFLKEFRQMGYKTFHPYIDETYDTIVNDQDRMTAIINEIERISKLPTDKFNKLIAECEKIAQHNILIMAEAKKHVTFTKEFNWVTALTAKARFVSK
jgi:hypothetical protein